MVLIPIQLSLYLEQRTEQMFWILLFGALADLTVLLWLASLNNSKVLLASEFSKMTDIFVTG
jgi:hypothetical protein